MANTNKLESDIDPYEFERQQSAARYDSLASTEFDSDTGSTTIFVSPATKDLPTLENPLHEYATYTYGLTLFMLTDSEFNRLNEVDLANGEKWDPKYALVSSAGRYNNPASNLDNDPGRIKQFQGVDFFIDNLRMQTIIGMNSRTRGTNAIDIGFTITEPMGLSFLDRLIEAATDKTTGVSSPNYIAQPYLLQIDFFGSKELGETVTPIPGMRKRIPIRINEMKIKATTKGSEYTIKAMIFNHQALQETAVHTPVNFEINASTVGNFFKTMSTDISLADQINYRESGTARLKRQGATKITDLSTVPYTVTSFTDAINSWFTRLVSKKNAAIADEVAFVIDPLFADSPITNPAASNPKKTAFGDSKKNAASNTGAVTPDINKAVNIFSISAGTSIVDVINTVMRNSKYFKDQLFDPVNKNYSFRENETVKFFKIVPRIELKGFDQQRNRYATKTTYYVLPYEFFNTKHPNLPYATPTAASKEFNYMYTGKNIDVLDFAIDFNATYYTAVQVDRTNASQDSPMPNLDTNTTEDDTPAIKGTSPTSIGQNNIVFRTGDKGAASTDVTDANDSLAANAMKSIYSEARGDMINIKLKILGDPHLIKQDDVFTNPGFNRVTETAVDATGSIMMDYSEIYCRVNFKMPSDIDEKTGLMKTFNQSKFSGMYRIFSVDNEFSRGQFTQTLDCVRIFDDIKNVNSAGGGRGKVNPPLAIPRQSNFADKNQSLSETARLSRQEASISTTSDELTVRTVAAPIADSEPIDQARQEYLNINAQLRR